MSSDQTVSANPSLSRHAAAAPDGLTLVAFGVLIVLMGSTSIGIRQIYEELAPFWSGALRYGLVALLFWLLLLVRRVPFPRGRSLGGAMLFGFLGTGAGLALLYFGLTETPASMSMTLLAIVPLLTFLFAVAQKLERLRINGVIGGILAAVGITIAVSGSLSAGVALSPVHLAAILVAAACFAEEAIVVQFFPHIQPLALTSVATTIGTLILGAASLAAGESWTLPASLITWLVLAYLVLTSLVMFLLFLFVLRRWTASGASYLYVLSPTATVILASLLTDEAITLVFVAGTAVVLSGVYIGTMRKARVAPVIT